MSSLLLPSQTADGYKSASQIARVTTEAWAATNLYCPNCQSSLLPCPANTKTKDFDCEKCGEPFQLKSLTGSLEKNLLGAEYATTLACIEAGQHPSLILLRYSRTEMLVSEVRFIHRAWITRSCLVARKPLGPNARRAGWQGSVFVLNHIPDIAKIDVVQNRVILPRINVCSQWQIAQQMMKQKTRGRGWTADVLRIVERLNSRFMLSDVYDYEGELARLHPENRHIYPKIRQQLQIIRDLGLIIFEERGIYRKVK